MWLLSSARSKSQILVGMTVSGLYGILVFPITPANIAVACTLFETMSLTTSSNYNASS